MLVVVQRGHVPRTSGATGAPGEQQFAIDTAAALAPRLRAMGHDVRVIDADEPNDRYRGDLFVAIHYDSGAASASGASVGYQTPEGAKFAAAWKAAYVDAGWTRGFRPDNYTANLGGYYGVRIAASVGNRMAIITESGFHSNVGDKALMSPDRTARSIAAAIAQLTNREMEDDMSAADVAKIREDIAELRSLLTEPNLTATVDGVKQTKSVRQHISLMRTTTVATLRVTQRLAEAINADDLARDVADLINRLDADDVVDELADRIGGQQ